MNIFIAGSSGFVGRNLIPMFIGNGHKVTAVSRSSIADNNLDANITYLNADMTKVGAWQTEVQKADVVVNLAGATIFHYWTKSYKNKIYESRVLTTKNLIDALPANRDIVLINASAAGFYGDRGDQTLTETETVGSDFLATVCRDWESEARKAEEKGARVVITRFGVVLGDNGGALGIMKMPFTFFVGGPMGNGQQWFPWIHIADLVAAFQHLLNDCNASGVYNLTAPQPIQNKNMAKIIGQILRRPALFKIPGFAIRALMGEFGTLLLYSQRAIPERLLKHDFQFLYPDIRAALTEIFAE